VTSTRNPASFRRATFEPPESRKQDYHRGTKNTKKTKAKGNIAFKTRFYLCVWFLFVFFVSFVVNPSSVFLFYQRGTPAATRTPNMTPGNPGEL
jgi:hypothetical protein